MARGYLGKISAIVSANTGDYVRKLDDSARRTRAFAATIQNDLNRASRESAKALSSMLTPLQRLERAIQNATSQRLKFNGVDTAINDVKQLQAAISRLEGSEIDVAVRASGLRTITELKTTLQNLKQEDVDLFVNLVGAKGTVADLQRIRESYREIDGKVVSTNVAVKADVSQVDRLIELFGQFSKQRLDAVINVVGQQQVDKAAQSMRQLASVTEGLSNPLSKSVAQFGSLSSEIQVAFGPALQRAQKGVQNLADDIQRGATISERRFAGVTAAVETVTAAISRLNEAQSLANSGQTGQELAFAAPRVQDELSRSAQLSQQAANLPVVLREDPSVRARIEELARLRQEIARYQASVERRQVLGLDTREAQAQLDGVIRRSSDARAALERVTGADAAPIIARQRAQQEFYEEDRRLRQQALADQRAEAEAAAAPIIARQRAQQEFYEEDRRLRQQALADQRAEAEAAAAPIIARARAEREFYEESRRLRQQAEDDNRAAAQRASELLAVDQLASNEGLRSQRATVLPPDYFQRGFESQIRGELGPAITDQRRQLDVLRGSIVSVKGQLDTLPVAVRAQFIPAIQQAETEFQRLRAIGPDATAEAIENASNEVERLNQQLRRASQVQALPNFAQALDDSAIRGAIGNLNALQQVLTRVGAQAGSDAAVQFDRMRAAIQRATRDGTIGTEAFQNELRQLSREAANAAAATGRISANAAFRQIQRGGDIARGGFDNISLAVQQAAFAIDDFFSSTGDFTQRIRAVQNNVTQLAFILGGTTGLFIGLGVAIAAQAGVALYNWINGGRTAEDQTKALNDALARQKSLVEELAGAFESLGGAIARRAFSEPAQQAREFAKEIDGIAKKQRELREGRIADLDPAVQRERANQNRIRREIDASSDPGRRLLLQAEFNSSQTREQRAREAAVSRPAPGIADLRRIVSDTVDVEFASQMRGRRGPTEEEVRRRENQRQAALENLGDGSDLRNTRAGLQDRLAGLRASRFANDEIVRNAAVQLEQQIALIDSAIQAGVEQTVRNIVESSLGAALAIEQAQSDVADAIRRGVSGAADFQAALDGTAQQLVDAQKQLQEAQTNESLSPEARDRAIRRAEDRVRDVENRRDAINEQARVLRLTTGRGGERTTAALSALQGNEDFSNEYGRLVARLRAAIDEELAAQRELNQQIAKRRKIEEDASLSDAQKQTQLQQQQADEAEARARVDRAAADSDLAAATAEAAQAMNKALSRIKKIGEDALSQSAQLADDAQRNLTRDPTSANRRARDEAERQLISDRERVARANNALARARSEAEGDPVIRGINDQLRAIEEERKRLSDQAAQAGTQVDPREAERLANEEARLLAEREQRLQSLTQAEREQQDAIAQEINARQRLIEQLERERQFSEELDRRRNPVGDPTRGLDLMEAPGQRAGRELAQGIADISSSFDEQLRVLLDSTNGLPNADIGQQAADLRQQRADAEARLIEQSQRAVAPAIFALSDSVENAVLQGPSRAALGVADVSTQEGARELNRLLRGEDSARDQNLVELQKQSSELSRLNQKIEEISRKVGVA